MHHRTSIHWIDPIYTRTHAYAMRGPGRISAHPTSSENGGLYMKSGQARGGDWPVRMISVMSTPWAERHTAPLKRKLPWWLSRFWHARRGCPRLSRRADISVALVRRDGLSCWMRGDITRSVTLCCTPDSAAVLSAGRGVEVQW